jgi:hypothetical protein
MANSTKSAGKDKPKKPYPEFPFSRMRRSAGQRRFAGRRTTSARGMTLTPHCRSTLNRKTTCTRAGRPAPLVSMEERFLQDGSGSRISVGSCPLFSSQENHDNVVLGNRSARTADHNFAAG